MSKKNTVSKGPGSGMADTKKMTKENLSKEAQEPGGSKNAAGMKEAKKKNTSHKK